MRLLVTADLHYNHPRSRPLADELIDRMNRRAAEAHFDALLLVGDTAPADGDWLERCLARFDFPGLRLFVAGNHELWTAGPDSYVLYTEDLPRRVNALGWHWLETQPAVVDGVGVVGTVGWYDYSFALAELGVPRRFYEHKVSPGAAEQLGGRYDELMQRSDDVTPAARRLVSRWNDGRFVKLHRPDEAFLDELLRRLRTQLESLRDMRSVVAAVHHLPFGDLLPPPRGDALDFARAYLGTSRLGDLLREFPNVRHVVCGHSHLPGEAHVGGVHAINIGSGYRWKTFREVEVESGPAGSAATKRPE